MYFYYRNYNASFFCKLKKAAIIPTTAVTNNAAQIPALCFFRKLIVYSSSFFLAGFKDNPSHPKIPIAAKIPAMVVVICNAVSHHTKVTQSCIGYATGKDCLHLLRLMKGTLL